MSSPTPPPPLILQEATELIALQSAGPRRFMSVRPAWIPGSDLPPPPPDLPLVPNLAPIVHKATYGACVFIQSALAAYKSLGDNARGIGVHSIYGTFSQMGHGDRPFVFEVTPLSKGRSFLTTLVSARQPLSACPILRGRFSRESASLPLGGICLTSICTFKRPSPAIFPSHQEPPPQARFASYLTRPPTSWPPAPSVDIQSLNDLLPSDTYPSNFPIIEMRKVNMAAHNENKPLHEKCELLLYRLLAPLPPDDPHLHVLVHAFASDRNGFPMLANNMGLGSSMRTAATLAFAFHCHVNPDEAVMGFDMARREEDWWVMEVVYPRAAASRGMMHGKLWSPAGVHVATGYQDGVVRLADKALPRSMGVLEAGRGEGGGKTRKKWEKL